IRVVNIGLHADGLIAFFARVEEGVAKTLSSDEADWSIHLRALSSHENQPVFGIGVYRFSTLDLILNDFERGREIIRITAGGSYDGYSYDQLCASRFRFAFSV